MDMLEIVKGRSLVLLYVAVLVFVMGYPIVESLAAELIAQSTAPPSTQPAPADVPLIRETEALAAFQHAIVEGRGAPPEKPVAKPPPSPRSKKSRPVPHAT